MAVNVKIGTEDANSDVKVNITGPSVKTTIQKPIISKFQLEARETLNGDIMIFDHKDIDIILLKDKKKVIAFAKDLMSEAVYGAENRLMTFLKKRGIIAYDSIQGGNVYGSLEGQLLESDKLNITRVTLKNIAEWMTIEEPAMEGIEDYDEMIDDWYADPDEDDSTPLGKISQEEEKGSIMSKGMHSAYYYGNYMWENKKLEGE
jgi:hypothetical protein